MEKHFLVGGFILFLLFLVSEIPAEEGYQKILGKEALQYLENDYFLQKAKLKQAQRSRSQLSFFYRKTHEIHLREWAKERKDLLEDLAKFKADTEGDLIRLTHRLESSEEKN